MNKNELEEVYQSLELLILNVQKGINPFKGVKPFPGLNKLKQIVFDFEDGIKNLLDTQKKYYIAGIKGYSITGRTDIFRKIIGFLNKKLIPKDKFDQNMSKLAARYLELSIDTIMPDLMNGIDKEVPYDGRLSNKTKKWIDNWSRQMGNNMKITSTDAVKRILKNGIKNGLNVDEIADKLEKLPEFDRARAKRVATTEVLAASEVGKHEAYTQSPAVVGKVWRHHPSQNPRHTHEALDDTFVKVNEYFDVNGNKALHPRDPSLPAGERINCRCSTEPVIDKKKKADLSKLEKLQLRDKQLRG